MHNHTNLGNGLRCCNDRIATHENIDMRRLHGRQLFGSVHIPKANPLLKLESKGPSGCTPSKKCSKCQGPCPTAPAPVTPPAPVAQKHEHTTGDTHINIHGPCLAFAAIDHVWHGDTWCHGHPGPCCSVTRLPSLPALAGDRDRDRDCGSGLKCFQRNRKQSMPGCSGPGVNGWDNCVGEQAHTNYIDMILCRH